MTATPASAGTVTGSTPLLDSVVRAVREIVRRRLSPQPTAELVGAALRGRLGEPGLLAAPHREGHPDRYRQHLLHREPDGSFSIVALVWLPGQQTPIHDHVSWCVAGVHQGQESEQRYRAMSDGPVPRLVLTEEVLNPVGAISAFAPPGDIHRVRNAGAAKAISIHVYGADVAALGSSIRRVYPAPSEGT